MSTKIFCWFRHDNDHIRPFIEDSILENIRVENHRKATIQGEANMEEKVGCLSSKDSRHVVTLVEPQVEGETPIQMKIRYMGKLQRLSMFQAKTVLH